MLAAPRRYCVVVTPSSAAHISRDHLCNAEVPAPVEMQAVGLGIHEKFRSAFVKQRKKSALAVKVDKRHRPNVCRFSYSLYVVLKKHSRRVCIKLAVLLNVAVAESRIRAVYRRHKHYELIVVAMLEERKHAVEPAAYRF